MRAYFLLAALPKNWPISLFDKQSQTVQTKRSRQWGGKRSTTQSDVRKLTQAIIRIPVCVYNRRTQHYAFIEPSWVISCPNAASIRYVRARLKALMEELDGTIVVEDEAEPEAPAGPEAPK